MQPFLFSPGAGAHRVKLPSRAGGSRLLSVARTAIGLFLAALMAGPALAANAKAYVGNFKDSTVSVIDTGSGSVIATVPVAAGPDGIAITPDGAVVFVSGSSASTVSVIDAATDRVTQAIEVGKGPQGLAMSRDGRLLLVAVNTDDRVAFVDPATRAVTGTLALVKPHTIAIRPDSKVAYVAAQEPGHFALVAIDLTTRMVISTVALDKPPRDLEFGHDGKALYFTLAGVSAVQVLDPTTNKIVAQIATGASPHIAHYFAGTSVGVVVVQGPGELLLFNPATNAPIRSIPVGKQPHWVDISADGTRMLVSNEGSNSVTVVDLVSDKASTIAVGNAPRKVAVQRAAAKGGAQISIANFAFEPAQITVTAGESVIWTNNDGAPHGLKFNDGAQGTELMLPGQTFSRAYTKAGSYEYVCAVHPYMTARVIVRAP